MSGLHAWRTARAPGCIWAIAPEVEINRIVPAAKHLFNIGGILLLSLKLVIAREINAGDPSPI
jgi:hypothetical protein